MADRPPEPNAVPRRQRQRKRAGTQRITTVRPWQIEAKGAMKAPAHIDGDIGLDSDLHTPMPAGRMRRHRPTPGGASVFTTPATSAPPTLRQRGMAPRTTTDFPLESGSAGQAQRRRMMRARISGISDMSFASGGDFGAGDTPVADFSGPMIDDDQDFWLDDYGYGYGGDADEGEDADVADIVGIDTPQSIGLRRVSDVGSASKGKRKRKFKFTVSDVTPRQPRRAAISDEDAEDEEEEDGGSDVVGIIDKEKRGRTVRGQHYNEIDVLAMYIGDVLTSYKEHVGHERNRLGEKTVRQFAQELGISLFVFRKSLNENYALKSARQRVFHKILKMRKDLVEIAKRREVTRREADALINMASTRKKERETTSDIASFLNTLEQFASKTDGMVFYREGEGEGVGHLESSLASIADCSSRVQRLDGVVSDIGRAVESVKSVL